MTRAHRFARWIAVIPAGALASAWLVGRIASDRFLWSQFLLWIPTLAPALLFAIAALWELLRRRRRAAVLCGAGALVLIAWIAFVDHALFAWRGEVSVRASHAPGTPDTSNSSLALVHCNLNWPGKAASPEVMQFIATRRDDLVIFSEPGWLLLQQRGKTLEEAGWTVARGPRFAVLSRLPIIEFRSLIWDRSVAVTLLRIDASSRGLGELRVGLIDLPSSLTLGRMEIARGVGALLAEIGAPPFDLVVGDCNITRGAASIRELFPTMHDAFDSAGRGCSGSFPAWLPLWHIDHTLLSPTLQATRYRLAHCAGARHLAQEVEVHQSRER